MLLLAAAALLMPAIFELVEGRGCPSPGAEIVNYGSTVEHLSLAVAIVLIVTYVARPDLLAQTHRDLFNPEYEDEDSWGWSVRTSVIALAIAGVAVGRDVGDPRRLDLRGLEGGRPHRVLHRRDRRRDRRQRRRALGRGPGREKNKMDLAVNIAIGSSAQIALFVAPVLVLASFFIGPGPLALVFNGFELGAAPARRPDRQLRHPGRRVDLVRGRAAARRLRRPRPRLLPTHERRPALLVSFAVILAGALLFTNAVEWIGHRLEVGEGAVGSVLAAVGTAMPETLIAIVALIGARRGPIRSRSARSSARPSCSPPWRWAWSGSSPTSTASGASRGWS